MALQNTCSCSLRRLSMPCLRLFVVPLRLTILSLPLSVLFLLLTVPPAGAAERFIEGDAQLAFSAEQFIELGRSQYGEAWSTLASQGMIGCKGSRCGMIRRAFQRINAAARSQQRDGTPPGWKLIITRSARDDACSYASGEILISHVFADRLELTEDEVAYVIAHESSHILLEHARAYATVALALLPHSGFRRLSDVYAQMNFDFGFDLRLLPFSIDQEFEADQAGLLLGALAGYDPAKMLPLLKKLEGSGSAAGSLMATHAPAEERRRRAQATLPLARRIYARAAGVTGP